MHRRTFIKNSLKGGSLVATGAWLSGCASIHTNSQRPSFTSGFASGDVGPNDAVLWSHASEPAQLWVALSTRPDRAAAETFKGGVANAANGLNAHAYLQHLIPGTQYYYTLRFQSLRNPKAYSKPVYGSFKTAPSTPETVRFCWSGDTAGQGFGIDPAHGGMLTYAAMLRRKPDFFVHSGDLIYADNPMPSEKVLDDGSIWRNELVEAKTKVAETVDEFRENFLYNYRDQHVRAFHAEVPVIQQWDDHEVVNNWYPGEQLIHDDRYTVKDVDTLASRAKTAYFNCNPMRPHDTDPRRIYRKIERGPLLDLFVIDLRSYRGPNTFNHQSESGPETAFLGADQLAWLKRSLKESTATWKIICSDMPIGLVIAEWGKEIYENGANGEDGVPLGRELEIAELLRYIAREEITNTHFITADVHYCASHYYDPAKASFKDFKPFWEFVSGPLHSGSFGPNPLDMTFGPEVKFCGIPDDLPPFSPPSKGYQFFGEMEIDAATNALTVRHFNRNGDELWAKELPPEEST